MTFYTLTIVYIYNVAFSKFKTMIMKLNYDMTPSIVSQCSDLLGNKAVCYFIGSENLCMM